MTCIPYGDRAVLINFEQKILPEINQQVADLSNFVKNLKGVIYVIPAYCSLTVVFDPQIISYKTLVKKIESHPLKKQRTAKPRKLCIPVCYDEKYGPDLQEVAQQTQLKVEEIVKLHTGTSYQIYMMGFIPGFAYMGRLDTKLHCRRREKPRRRVPTQSVGIAGQQTGIYPSEAPGGWQLIGKTPVSVFQHTQKDPFLFHSGDEVSFKAIDQDEFESIEEKISKGYFKFESLYV